MSKPATTAALVLLLLTACPTPARAFFILPVTTSIEAQFVESTLVVRGHFEPGSAAARGAAVIFNVAETFKGPTSSRASVLLEGRHLTRIQADEWTTEHLLFLKPHTGPIRVTVPADTPLYDPAGLGGIGSYALSAKGVADAYAMDGRPLRSTDQLLAVVRLQAMRPPPAPPSVIVGAIGLDSPIGAVPGRRLWVPADQRLEQLAQSWVDDPRPDYRATGVHALGWFRTPENARRVTKMLHDPAFILTGANQWVADPNRRVSRYYWLRHEASRELQMWGLDSRAELTGPERTYLPAGPFLLRWAAAIAALLTAAATTAACLARRGTDLPTSSRLVISLGLTAAGCAAGLMWRSHHIVGSLSFARQGESFELSSANGAISLLRVTDGAKPHGPMVTQGPPATDRYALWYQPFLTATTETSRAGLYAASGAIRTNRSPTDNYHLFRLTYAWLITLAALAPAAILMADFTKRLRRRRRSHQGQCRECGYDLRGHESPRCPECGSPKPRPSP